MGQIRRNVRRVVCFPIFVYQWIIRPVLKPCCRFYPSCSEYALAAIHTHGIFKGFIWAFFRICRCHPWSEGGYDPVIPNKEKC